MDGEKDSVYFCGNSLGLQPKEAQTLVMQEMEKWQQMYECWLKLHDLQLLHKWNFVYKLSLGILTVFICKSKIALRLLWCCLAVLRGLLIFCFHLDSVFQPLWWKTKNSHDTHKCISWDWWLPARTVSGRRGKGGGAFRRGVNCRFGFTQSRVLVGKVGKPMKIIPMNARSSYIWLTFSVSC